MPLGSSPKKIKFLSMASFDSVDFGSGRLGLITIDGSKVSLKRNYPNTDVMLPGSFRFSVTDTAIPLISWTSTQDARASYRNPNVFSKLLMIFCKSYFRRLKFDTLGYLM